MEVQNAWSEEAMAELTRLVATSITFKKIMEAINEKFGTSFTRNAVLGKANRLGISQPEKPKAGPYERKPCKKRLEQRVARATHNSNTIRIVNTVNVESFLRCVEVEPRHLSLVDLEKGDCRYPYGDQEITFCGHPQAQGSSYCPKHHFLCWEPSRPRIVRSARAA